MTGGPKDGETEEVRLELSVLLAVTVLADMSGVADIYFLHPAAEDSPKLFEFAREFGIFSPAAYLCFFLAHSYERFSHTRSGNVKVH